MTGKTITVFEHNPTTVLLVGDRLVLTGGGPVRAVDRNSGKTIWTSKRTSDNVVVQDGFVYVYLEGGEIAYPVNECTIAGNLRNMLKRIIPANDARTYLSRVVPSLLIEGMTLAGN